MCYHPGQGPEHEFRTLDSHRIDLISIKPQLYRPKLQHHHWPFPRLIVTLIDSSNNPRLNYVEKQNLAKLVSGSPQLFQEVAIVFMNELD